MIVAVLQVRALSSRLPGKALLPLAGAPMLQRQLERVRRAKKIDELVVATTEQASDDPIAELARSLGVNLFRGSTDDVLDRVFRAASTHRPTAVVRLTGDCPLADPTLIDAVIERLIEGRFDYVNNTMVPTYPDGLDVEAVRFDALADAHRHATLPSHREHVTLYVKAHPERFRLGVVAGRDNWSHLRWTVDEPEDYELVRLVYERLYGEKHDFGTDDVLRLLAEDSSLSAINTHIGRNEGLARSLARDPRNDAEVPMRTASLAMMERARRCIPGISQLLSKRPDQFSYGVWPAYFARAKGCEVWDLDGNRYVDMSIGGIGATILGYADPDVDAAVVAAIGNGVASSLNCAEDVLLAELLCELHPWAQMARFSRSGGEAMAVAVRIARAHTGRDVVAFCGYHGWHDWYLAANLEADRLGEHLLAGLEPAGVPQALRGTALPFRYNNIEDLEAVAASSVGRLAAIVMEPLRNLPPDPGFIDAVHRIAERTHAVLVVDEISAGFRLRSAGAHFEVGLRPDIAVFSKGIGNGYPIAAVIGKSEVMESAQRTFISSTNWTERTGPTAALATIRKHREKNVAAHLVRLGAAVQEGWRNAAGRHGLAISVRGMKPMSHFSFQHVHAAKLKALFVQWMLDEGFLATTSFYAMYAHRDAHVSSYFEAVDRVFSRITKVVRDGDIDRELRGKPAGSGFSRIA